MVGSRGAFDGAFCGSVRFVRAMPGAGALPHGPDDVGQGRLVQQIGQRKRGAVGRAQPFGEFDQPQGVEAKAVKR